MNSSANNPNPWKLGVFYYDTSDKRLWVPKRIPVMGFTINFAHRYAWIIGVALVAIMAWAVFVAIKG